MAKSKRRPTPSAPVPDYLTLQRQRLRIAAHMQGAPSTASMPSTGYWRINLDKAFCILLMVADQMQVYYEERPHDWHITHGAALFTECLDDLCNIQGLLDDLRSNF